MDTVTNFVDDILSNSTCRSMTIINELQGRMNPLKLVQIKLTSIGE